ncbi:MAG TPA: TetR/AcrR family transcriptional regulator, partial [Gaiellaceae bacterium]|nr:TetR/AcrR family transcriptional regulator [Gaiellaceae bacterium]
MRRRLDGASKGVEAPALPAPRTGAALTAKRLTGEARRQAVLDTACRVFSQTSYRGATTAEIAREAGISEPILYRHFGSKRDLYLACLDEAWRAFRVVSEAAVAADPEQCLGAIADAYMAKGRKLRVVDLWIQALNEASDDRVIAAAVRRQIREVRDFFADVIRDGQRRGVV